MSISQNAIEVLRQFFGGYFHQDWDVEGATSSDVMAAFFRESPDAESLENIADALRHLLNADFSNDDAFYTYLNTELGCDYLPEGGSRPWVESLLREIEKEMDRRAPNVINRIDGDRWDGVLCFEWYIEAPSSHDLNHALERLDAKTYTMVTLQGAGEGHMTIGGGAGKYVVYTTSDNREFWNLLSPHGEDSIELLNIGGQEGEYPARHVVDLVQARAAAQKYFERQQRNSEQKWEMQ